MIKAKLVILCLLAGSLCCQTQDAQQGAQQSTRTDGKFKLALPSHHGEIRWQAVGFSLIETSAKPNGMEIGIRGAEGTGGYAFLGFIFLFPQQAPMTSEKCRDGIMGAVKAESPTLEVVANSEIKVPDGPPVELVTYQEDDRDGQPGYSVRGFIAQGDLCGDLELYSDDPIDPQDPAAASIFNSFRLDPSYTPQFDDALFYGQALFQNDSYKEAAPMFEQALKMLKDEKGADQRMWTRIATDQAAISYGGSGNIPKARALLEAAIAQDPDYPLYYYNLACADAAESKLSDARTHLKQAFARKANVMPGETMPDPSKEKAFLARQDNQEFWDFIESLH